MNLFFLHLFALEKIDGILTRDRSISSDFTLPFSSSSRKLATENSNTYISDVRDFFHTRDRLISMFTTIHSEKIHRL